jgi:hypothetical protein
MYFRQSLQSVEEGGAINGEVAEALSPNRDRKEEALKGRLKVSVYIARVKGDNRQECKRGGKWA